MTNPSYSADALLQTLKNYPQQGRYWVAYSGGMDSHVLLVLMADLRKRLPVDIGVVHINHGLSASADKWAEHCASACRQLEIDYRAFDIQSTCPAGESLEAWARNQRYALFEKVMNPEEILLTAHHQDDQAETLLLQLLRGAGAKGLSAMPGIRRLGSGWLARPLLSWPRREIERIAQARSLLWIEDESNFDTGFDRNYIRRQLTPLLAQRWSGFSTNLARAASHQAEMAGILDELAIIDHRACSDGDFLQIPGLLELSLPRQKNLIRYWLKSLQLPAPDMKRMQRILKEVIMARQDAMPTVSWSGVEIRRYRHLLVASVPMATVPGEIINSWKLTQPQDIGFGRLSAGKSRARGIACALLADDCLQVRFRKGGESIRPVGKPHHYQVKKLFQEAGVPPWYRDRIPLLYRGGELIAIPGFVIAEGFQAQSGEEGWVISWSGMETIAGFTRCFLN